MELPNFDLPQEKLSNRPPPFSVLSGFLLSWVWYLSCQLCLCILSPSLSKLGSQQGLIRCCWLFASCTRVQSNHSFFIVFVFVITLCCLLSQFLVIYFLCNLMSRTCDSLELVFMSHHYSLVPHP